MQKPVGANGVSEQTLQCWLPFLSFLSGSIIFIAVLHNDASLRINSSLHLTASPFHSIHLEASLLPSSKRRQELLLLLLLITVPLKR